MYTKFIVPNGWDNWVKMSGFQSGFCQTACWAAIHYQVNKIRPYWIIVKDVTGEPIIGALLGHKVGAGIRGVMGKGGTLECFEGPVTNRFHVNEDWVVLFLEKVNLLGKELQVDIIKFNGIPSFSALSDNDSVNQIFFRFGYCKTSWLTSLVDLTLSKDVLMKSIHHSARKGIRKCMELGIQVKECKSFKEYMDNFHIPFFETRVKLNQKIPQDYKKRTWWEIDQGKNYHYFVAFDPIRNITLGTLGTYTFNKMVTEIMSERTEEARVKKLAVQDLLHWHVFNFHKALGNLYFNLAGFSPEPKDEKERGIRAFKEKWGGKIVTVCSYSKECNNSFMYMKKSVKKIKNKLLRSL